MTRLYLIFLALVPAALASQNCPVTSCDYNGLTWTGQVCGQLSTDQQTYYFNPTICSNHTEYCNFTNFQSDSVCVSTDVVQVFDAYPGEKCTYLHGCASGNCVKGMCEPFSVCQNYYDCGIGSYCSPGIAGVAGTCQALQGAGETCYHSYECKQNMGCDQAADGYPGICRLYLTVRPGDYIKQCSVTGMTNFGRSFLCISTYCYNFSGGYRCTDIVKSASKTLPIACEMGSECLSEVDGVSGLAMSLPCTCGFNKNGQGYCPLQRGDPARYDLLGLWADFLNSTDILKCNTYSRADTNVWLWCMQSVEYKHYWRLWYHDHWVNNYAQLVKADDCYIKYVAYPYWVADQHYSAATLLGAAALFLLY